MSTETLYRAHGHQPLETDADATHAELAAPKLGVWRFGLAVTAAFSVMYVGCAMAVALVPQETLDFFNNWFHGLDLNLLRPAGGRILTLQQFVAGWLAVVAVAFPAGALLAWTYNLTGPGTPQSR